MSGPSFEVPPLSSENIFQLTASIRRNLKLDYDEFPIIEFLELGMSSFFEGFVFEVRDRAEMGSNHGLTIPSENAIVLREDVYERACDRQGRDRFTAAHELGHYIMHRNAPLKFHRAESGKLAAYKDSEWQANRFAGALLMPESRVVRCGSLAEVAERFGVTMDAARVQNSVLAKANKMRVLS